MCHIDNVTPNVDPEMRILHDELELASGGKKNSTAQARFKAFEEFVRDNDVTADEYWKI